MVTVINHAGHVHISDSRQIIKYQRLRESSDIILCGGVSNDYFQPFSIGVVPDELRKWNEDAYIPKVVSMGPRYKGATRDLQQMEDIKWRSLRRLFHRSLGRSHMIDACLEPVFDLDVKVRACYVDEIKLDRYELAAVMLNDGCFLLELIISGSKEMNEILKSHVVKVIVVRLEEVLTDLILLENQIPLIILKTLAENIFPEVFVHHYQEYAINTIEKLVHSFLGLSLDSSFDTNLDHYAAGHFLELVYVSIFENLQVQKNQESHHSETKITIDGEPHDVLKRCATKLQAAGVTLCLLQREIIADTDHNKFSDVDIKFNTLTSFNFDIEFNNGKLEIPRLHITERAKARWLNFIAWEHYKMKEKSFVNKLDPRKSFSTYKCKCTWAALLFNGLICCASDVQLLKDKRIIVDHSNMSNQDLVDFFSSIPKGVDPRIIDSNYVKMFHVLNTYSATPYATRIPIILWHYLTRIPELIYNIHRFFKKGYNFAAAFISLLTLIQTGYAVLSYHDPKK